MLLRSDRLLAFSDSVIVVAVVLLVYNLATFATTEPNAFQPQIFFSTLIVYVGSFIVVFFFWLTFTTLLEYIKNLNDIVASLSLIFLILVTLTPVGNILEQQQKSEKSLLFTSLIEITAGSVLLVIFFYVTKGKVPPNNVAKSYTGICLRDSLSLHCMFVCIFFEFRNSTTAYIFYYSHFCTKYELQSTRGIQKIISIDSV